MMDCCRVWYSGASHISQTSAAKRSLLAASVLSRFGDPASSSPSNANLMLALEARCRRRASHRARSGARRSAPCRRRLRGRTASTRDRTCAGWRSSDRTTAILDPLVAQRRLERRRRPFLRVERLAVVVRVEADGSRRAGRADFAEHNRIASGNRHQLRRDAALLPSWWRWPRVALDVLAIAGDVRNREKRDELVDDGSFVLLPPGAGRLRRSIRLREGSCRQETEERQDGTVSCHQDLSLFSERVRSSDSADRDRSSCA